MVFCIWHVSQISALIHLQKDKICYVNEKILLRKQELRSQGF